MIKVNPHIEALIARKVELTPEYNRIQEKFYDTGDSNLLTEMLKISDEIVKLNEEIEDFFNQEHSPTKLVNTMNR